MSLAAYFQPTFEVNHLGAGHVNLGTDTLKAGLIATSGLAARATSETYEFVSTLLANNGSPLTEVSAVGYARVSLSGVSYSASGLVITLTCSNIQFASATYTTYYGWIHDETASSGTDATRPLLCIFDWGGAQSVGGVPFDIQINASGLVTWTAAA